MTSTEIRQSFLDFFREKKHTVVPSSSLLPDSPNLLFTNAGMNQFVPIFLGQVKCPYSPGRAADTQKCIRAGGKHNDLDDVGLDTYHHTFFEMLGNWSFGDYFKKEAIEWAWELFVERWKIPASRIYVTVYQPKPGDPGEFDREAYDHWQRIFAAASLDPKKHIISSDENFWMMGETGPCGPCSELHIDCTPEGDGTRVNAGDSRCMEIWNLVFIQFNANPDGTFSPLPARHVDTGMGFERICSILQGTKNFTDFSRPLSNYETDIFRPIFDEIEKMSGKKYTSTLPGTPGPGSTAVPPSRTSTESRAQSETVTAGSSSQRDAATNRRDACATQAEQTAIDIAFRVIADHIRTLGFAIADGIQPGNNDRNYVLRRILRRAVRYGRTLGFHEPFFYKLVGVLARTMGDVFPEIRAKQAHVEEVLKREEEAFNKTLDTGIQEFGGNVANEKVTLGKTIPGNMAFKLYDTYGFPLDLTELMARERGLTVDVAGFEAEMEKQRARARAAQKKTVIKLSEIETKEPTRFIGYDQLSTPATVIEVVAHKDKTAVILDTTTAYAEMGGQVGDTGEIFRGADTWRITTTQKSGSTWLHFLDGVDAPDVGAEVTFGVEVLRRNAIQRHHTVTHLLHWALHEVVSREASQKGSFVGPDKLTFDFNSAALTPAQVRDVEKLVNERIVENAGVSWIETAYADVKSRGDVMQFFGDKYGDTVRVVQIGGRAGSLDGYSMELCGGTHTRATGEIGLFRIIGEAAIAAGVRRIEAVAGLTAWEAADFEKERLKSIAAKLNAPLGEIEKKLDALLAQQKDLEKSFKAAQQREAAGRAKELLAGAETINGTPVIVANLGAADGDTLQTVADALKSQGFNGVIVVAGVSEPGGNVSLVASVTPDFTAKAQAGKIIQQIAPIVGGKGGGRPDNARGGGRDAARLDEALALAKRLAGGV